MTPTSIPGFLTAYFSRLIQRVMGINYKLTDIVIDNADLDLDLGFGRD